MFLLTIHEIEDNKIKNISTDVMHKKAYYQLSLIFTAFLHVDLINIGFLTACVFIRSWWRCTFWMTSPMTLNPHKIDNNVIIASLKSEPMGKLINRIPGLRLLISCLPGLASRTHVGSLCKPRDSRSVLKALPDKLDIKGHSPSILYFISVHVRRFTNVPWPIPLLCSMESERRT